MISSINRFVAVQPFPVAHITHSVKSGIAMIDQKYQLTKLELVYDAVVKLGDLDLVLRPGDAIFVTSDQYVQPWAKKVYELVEGKPFILVSQETVVLVEQATRL